MSPDGSRRGLRAGGLLIEVTLLLEVGGHSGCGPARLQRGATLASHLKEVAADGVEAAVGVDPGIGRKTLDQFEAGPGPATMLTVDLKVMVIRLSYELTELGLSLHAMIRGVESWAKKTRESRP